MSCISPRSLLRLVLLLLISGLFPGYLSAQTADQYVQTGRQYLTQQTSQGLQNANAAFASALTRDPKNPKALILEAYTHVALLIQQPEFSTLLSQIGATQTNQNAYNFDIQFPIDGSGRALVASNAQSSSILNYSTNVLRPVLLDALSKLMRVPPSSSDILLLNEYETSTTPTVFDYGDVQALQAIIHLLLAVGYDKDTVNLQVALQDLLDLSDGYTTMQDLLSRYPSFIASIPAGSQRAEAKKHLIAGLTALGNAYTIALKPGRSYPSRSFPYSHLVMIDTTSARERALGNASLAQIKALAASVNGPTKIPSSKWNPNPLLDNQTLYLGALLNGTTSPRAWFGANSFYGSQLVKGFLPDPTFSGLFRPAGTPFLMMILEESGYLISPIAQTISFTPPVSVPFSRNRTISLSASGGASGQPVVFSSRSKNASISGNTMTLLGVGPVVITATQAGYVPSWQVGPGPYAAAAPVTRSLVVTKGTPQITLSLPSTVAYSNGLTVSVTASNTSDKPSTLVSSNPKVAAFQRNGSLLIKAPGTTVIRASVPASANFNAASTNQTLTVTP